MSGMEVMSKAKYNTALFRTDALRENLPYGVVVSQLDPEMLDNESLIGELRHIWIQEGLIVFKNLYGADVQLQLSQLFGRCIMHPIRDTNDADIRGVVDIKYDPEDAWIMRVDGELRGNWLPWHSDLIYVDKINRGGVLRPIEVPSQYGQTGFIDKVSTYDALPEDLKAKIEQLHVIYRLDLDVGRQRFGRIHDAEVVRWSTKMAQIMSGNQKFPDVVHPMVYVQHETGRKVLNLSPWHAVGIVEMPGSDGDELLEKMACYASDEEFAYHHDWKLGDMVLWDNWRMLHSAAGSPIEQVRWLQRTTIDGDYGLGRILDQTHSHNIQYVSV
jgi:taurine dioxygenase